MSGGGEKTGKKSYKYISITTIGSVWIMYCEIFILQEHLGPFRIVSIKEMSIFLFLNCGWVCQYSLYPRTVREWNMLPPSIRSSPDSKSFNVNLSQINFQELVKKAHFRI